MVKGETKSVALCLRPHVVAEEGKGSWFHTWDVLNDMYRNIRSEIREHLPKCA